MLVSRFPCSWICQLVPGCGCQTACVVGVPVVAGGVLPVVVGGVVPVVAGGVVPVVAGGVVPVVAGGVVPVVAGGVVPVVELVGVPVEVLFDVGGVIVDGGVVWPWQATAAEASVARAVRVAGSFRLSMH